MLRLCRCFSTPEKFDFNAAVDSLKEDGYVLFDYALEIIKNFGGFEVGPKGWYFKAENGGKLFKKHFIPKGTFQYTYFPHLQYIFTIDPTLVRDELDRMEFFGEYFSDYLIPLGIYDGNYLAVGKSRKVYEICPSIKAYVNILGNDFPDFLNRYYANEPPILHLLF
ncbi:MAG: SUKH-3 domain-containing protein [Oscillospiraceae bacterium]|nr:SUKH-3 domain-containing protein [Oscillospiraceae bacterium]